jgi:hypothetical protein
MISFDMEKPFNKSGPLVTPETNVNSFNVTSNKCESETKYFYFTWQRMNEVLVSPP